MTTKALFLTLQLLILPMVMNGQDFQNRMFVEGRSWKYEYRVPDYEHMTEEQMQNGTYGWLSQEYVLRVEGDTVADGRSCHKIMASGPWGKYLYAIGYDEGDRVMLCAQREEPAFWAPFPQNQWVMLYDFGVSKASTSSMKAFVKDNVTVTGEGSVWVAGNSCRYLILERAQDKSWVNYAVEGVGCSKGLFEFENIITNGSSSTFVGCYDGKNCIFTSKDFEKLSTKSSVVNSLKMSENHNVFDLQGRQLPDSEWSNSRMPKGIYIQNGRKVVR